MLLMNKIRLPLYYTSCSQINFLRNLNSDVSNKEKLEIVPPKHAKVVICGGGVMGASVAYHIGKLGWGADTVLLDQNK